MKLDPIEHPILLTENELNTTKDREAMAEIMFEEFNTPGLYIEDEAALSLRWYGRSTGVVVDCGDCFSSVVLFENGRRLPESTILTFGGRDVTRRLMSCLAKSGYTQFTSPADETAEAARKIKEEHGYVSNDYCQEVDLVFDRDPSQVHCEEFPRQVTQCTAFWDTNNALAAITYNYSQFTLINACWFVGHLYSPRAFLLRRRSVSA